MQSLIDVLHPRSLFKKQNTLPFKLQPFYKILSTFTLEGEEVAPRGEKCTEITNYSYSIFPRNRFMSFTHRKLNQRYAITEFAWYLRGDKYDTSIARHAKIWGGLINQDNSINSNYGHYLFSSDSSPGYKSNFDRVVETLRKDPFSRRAVIMILDNRVLCTDTKDYPCTAYLNFHIRRNALHMYVRMRSQDAIFGLTNDAICFSLTHELMWVELCKYYPDLKLGYYHHSADSLHVYERHYDMVKDILRDPAYFDVYCPPMEPGVDSLERLQAIANKDTNNLGHLSEFEIWFERQIIQDLEE